MILKSADDKSKRATLLDELQHSQLLDFRQRKWLRDELMRFKKGVQGEREAAHYLDNYFKKGENHVVLHDLRFVVDGEVAQIDHLIINRAFGFYLLETKNYAGNLVINEQGEFTVDYGEDRFGIASPIEQSKRHERILSSVLERLEIAGRTQKQAAFHHVVMLHPKAIITRPPGKSFDTSNVIKADQFPTWHQQFVEKIGVGTVFKSLLNIRSLDTIQEWGEKLMRQHRPADLLHLPDFMQPKQPAKATAAVITQTKSFSHSAHAEVVQVKPAPVADSHEKVGAQANEPAKRLICAHCGIKITYPEGKFCWNNAKRFGGVAYCRDHQALFSAVA
ncbi:nuclease-related domain-containing protein [Rhodoferax sp.]|uniref:nuclease-related domain-containing protein n=1 Tax=Rhodoferax sp. TaxID=50421 RepID=UPI002638362D|nr:nuclease-related domain-containing protein [Rhodoferax sp.]MDD2809360.1 nuclease-related domain-containing protein [Rhodoferax sp.]